MMSEDSEYTQPEVMAAEQSAKKRKRKSKRRFSEEQIRSLEMMFEAETKLEPRKKVQVAGELGLQPRQVAIWFQNKRARWKSKELENDYGLLRANYNALATSFEDLKKEKQALITQLQKLNDLVQKSREKRKGSGQDAAEDSIGDQLDEGEDVKGEFEATPSLLLERAGGGIHVFSDDDSSIRADYFGLDEEPELMSMVEPADSSENWGSLDSEGGLLDESDGSYQWWDFWT